MTTDQIRRALEQIASASPHVCHHATGDVRCCVCWAMIDLAREALGWEKWPAMSGTIIIKTKGDK